MEAILRTGSLIADTVQSNLGIKILEGGEPLRVVGNEKQGVGRLANVRRWFRTVAIDVRLFLNFVVSFL
jgi:hypothetical protein